MYTDFTLSAEPISVSKTFLPTILNLYITQNFTYMFYNLKTMYIYIYIYIYRGTAVAQWLRCCATHRKVAGSIPAGFIGNPSDRTIALGSTQPLTEMSTMSISWG